MISPLSAANAGFASTTIGFALILIFFHRRLRCLVIADLKVGKFSYADAGQMHMYLNYAREHWMKAGENPPVGLILCAEKGAAEAHYALDNFRTKFSQPNTRLSCLTRDSLQLSLRGHVKNLKGAESVRPINTDFVKDNKSFEKQWTVVPRAGGTRQLRFYDHDTRSFESRSSR